MTQNFSAVYRFRKTGSGQFLQPGQIYLSPGLAKIAPWCLARLDNLSAKVPGLVTPDGATNVYSLNRRADTRPLFYEMEDTGETLRVIKKFNEK